MAVWVTWESRGRDIYTNPRSRVAHLSEARSVSEAGSSPLACGRWTPSDWDAMFSPGGSRRCRRCEKALAAKERS